MSNILRPRQHSIGYIGDGFYRSKDPTNSIKELKEMLTRKLCYRKDDRAMRAIYVDRAPLRRYGHSKLPKMAAAAILNLFESKIASLDPPSPKTTLYSVSQKKSPLRGPDISHFSHKRLRIFNRFFTHILRIPIYARLQIFIQLSPILTKLCHIKRD